ncbi:MAG: response regulator, partial [Lachnospiraceae bacterium]|nr:response regulator [Lachnospiraceae bacterium]
VKLEESQMAYRVAIENDRICLWHYDILTQTYFQDQTTAEELEELISVQPDYPETKILMGDVRKDSEEKLRALFDKICAGEEMVQDEIWIRSAVDPEEFICTKVYIRNLRDEFGEIIRTVGITRNITEEIQNRIQKQKYELAIADSSLSIWEFDLNNDTYSISEETAGRFGIPAKGEGMPEVLLDNGLILKDSEETYLDMYRQLKDGITQIRAEMHLRNKDGGDNWQECTYYTVCDDRGEPSYAIGCSLDYTAIRIKERHYQEELEIQKADLNEQMISKARADVTTGIIETMSYEERHDTAEEVPTLEELSRIMQKFAEDDAMKKNLATVFSKEYLLSSYADGKKELSFEGKAAVSEGMPKWVKVLVRLHTNPENGHIMAFIYAYDVNREHSVADIFNHVVDQDYEFVGVVDGVTGRYKTFEKQGYNGPRPGTEGDTFVEDMLKLEKYLLPEEQERFRTVMDYSHILGVLDQGRQAAAVFGCMYDNKEVHYLRFRASYTDPATRRFIITATDVSDIIEGENTNHTALAHALKNANDAVQIKSAVLSKVTHDVRTPLASITGLLSLMKEAASKVVMTKEERAKFDQYFRQLDASSTELLNSINDVQTLDTLDKESRLHISDYSFTALLTELSNKTAKEASLKGVHYKADFGNLTDRMMKIDVSKVRNMMSVLFYNAVRYTPAGKQVQMMANEAPYGDNKIIYTISIKDNGVGISKDLMPHIFDLFSKERTGYRDGYNGTGLELPVAKQLADVMQADLSADSLLGKGSTFTVTLPLEIAEDAGGGTGTSADSNKKKDPSDVIFAERRVLIAEDNEMNAEVTRMILENKGISVMVAANGEETLRLYQDNEPGYFDAILMDLRMPVMDGFEATRQIRSAGRADSSFIPIIAMSADMYEEDIKACEEAGMNRNLNKPIQPDLLFDTLAELMY